MLIEQIDSAALDNAIEHKLAYRHWPASARAAAALEADRRSAGELRVYSLLGAALAIACLVLDAANGILAQGIQLRALTAMPVYLIAALFAPQLAPRWRLIGFAVPMALFGWCSVSLGNYVGPDIADRYLIASALSAGTIGLLLPLRILDVLCAVALMCAAILSAYLSHHALNQFGVLDMSIFLIIGCFAPIPLAARMNRLKDRNFLLAVRARLAQDELLAANDALRAMSESDALTGLANRRSFERIFNESFSASLEAGLPVAVLMIDIDHFKRFNDNYGHQAGDECIRAVAQVIGREAKAAGSIAARYGGEEFIVVSPSAAGGAALHLSERIRARVSELAIAVKQDEPATVTVSVGVAVGAPRTVRREDLIEHADQALYTAKHAGRNRVAIHARPAAADLRAKTPRLEDRRVAGRKT